MRPSSGNGQKVGQSGRSGVTETQRGLLYGGLGPGQRVIESVTVKHVANERCHVHNTEAPKF